MSDNVQITQGSGTYIAAEAISGTAGALVQRVKVVIGDLDTDSGDVAADNPMPVLGTITATGTVTVLSGTAVNLLASIIGTVGINTVVVVSCGTAANLLATVTQSSTVTSIVTAGTAFMGQVAAGLQTAIYNGTASVQVGSAVISFSTSSDNTIVSAIANKNIYVVSGVIICSLATNLTWYSSSSAGTAITGAMPMTANMGFQIPFNPLGNFATQATGQNLVLNSSVAATVGGWITYIAY